MSESTPQIVMYPGWPRELHEAQQRWQEHYLECDECGPDRDCPVADRLLAAAIQLARDLSAPTLQKGRLRR